VALGARPTRALDARLPDRRPSHSLQTIALPSLSPHKGMRIVINLPLPLLARFEATWALRICRRLTARRKHSPHSPHSPRQDRELGNVGEEGKVFSDIPVYDIGFDHVAFGAGIHLCVSQTLARLEAEMLMTALAARVVDIIGEPQRKLSNSLRQFASLPVELIAAQ
jgi:hypothetical protein